MKETECVTNAAFLLPSRPLSACNIAVNQTGKTGLVSIGSSTSHSRVGCVPNEMHQTLSIVEDASGIIKQTKGDDAVETYSELSC